ncbi:MAG: TetR/AcrR family transcriptional regulator [Acidobacteria bacterium]|nr:TetR/AcrR family transcriptional regulator [Acidobacteriota bacterium]
MKAQRLRRDRICAVATELFSEKGYAATTTREICQKAGITKPVLYYYFGSKEQLFRELIVDACNESRKQLLLASRRAETAPRKLVEVLAADFEGTRRDPSLARLFIRMLFAAEKGSPAIDYVELGMDWIRFVTGIVGEGVRRGELKGRPREIAEMMMGIHFIYTMGYLLMGKPALDRRLARRIVNTLLRGCGKNPTDR